MGGFKLTGLGAGTSATDAAQFGQLQNAPVATLITVSGADTITGTLVQTLTAYATGQQFSFVAAGTNTTAVTLNIDGLGAKAVTRTGAVALDAGALVSGQMAIVEYDGTRFQLINANAFTNLTVSGALTVGTTLAVTGVATLTAQPILSSLTASLPVFSDASKGLVSNAMTGTGSVMMSASPTTTGTLTAAAINASGTVTGSADNANFYANSTNATGYSSIYFQLSGSNKGAIYRNHTAAQMWVTTQGAADPLILGVNTTEVARVASTGLSVTGTLSIGAATAPVISKNATYGLLLDATGAGGSTYGFGVYGNGGGVLMRNAVATTNLEFPGSISVGGNITSVGGTLGVTGALTAGTAGTSVNTISGVDRILTLASGSASANSLLRFKDSSVNKWAIGYNNPSTDRFLIYDEVNGATAIGCINGASPAVYIPSIWANTGGTTAVMVDSAGTLFKLASARKYKMDIAPYTKGLAEVLKLDPQYYRIKSQGEDSHIYAGLIADDLDAQGLSEFVAYGPEGVDSINYGHMAALFANAIKELSADFEAYKAAHP